MPDELALFSDSVDERKTKFETKEPFRRHETKKRYPGKEVKIRIIPEECIFSQEVITGSDHYSVGKSRSDHKIHSTEFKWRNSYDFCVIIE